MTWIYLSPHLDDAAFSCGGLIWQQVQAGEDVEIWTICAGSPPEGELPPFAQSLHQRWGTGPETVAQRRVEDEQAARALGVKPRWFEIPDCIYRRDPKTGKPLYAAGAAIFGNLHPADKTLLSELSDTLAGELPADARVVAPLTIGNHVYHQLVRQAADTLSQPLSIYADFPYIINNGHLIAYRLPPGAKSQQYQLSEEELGAWQAAVACYTSQLSTFWGDEAEMRQALQDYVSQNGGLQLWQRAQ